MRRNLVLGSEGFIGRPFCEHLRARGETVVRFDVKRGAHEDARFVRLPLDGVDRVYFLAWDVGGAKYLYRPDTQLAQMEWNTRLLLNVLPQLEAAGAPFLFVSSHQAARGEGVYGATKLLGEQWTGLLSGACLRVWSAYGCLEDESERSHAVSDFVWQAVRQGEIRMMSSGEETRQFVHVDDVCRAFTTAMDDGRRGLYDVASREPVAVRRVAELVAELAGATARPGNELGVELDTPHVAPLPGWRPQVPLRDGLRRMVEQAGATAGAKR